MKINRFSLLLYGWGVFWGSFAHSGGLIGNAGSVVKNENGNWVPASLYFSARQYQLPDYYQPYELSPEVREQLETAMTVINRRSLHQLDLKRIFDETEFYSTDRFLGEDILPVLGKEHQQVAFSYWFTVPIRDQDGIVVSSRKRRVIEINKNRFEALGKAKDGRWHPIIEIIHELLHQAGLVALNSHDYISPLVNSLNEILLGLDQQNQLIQKNPSKLPKLADKILKNSDRFQRALLSALSEINDKNLDKQHFRITDGGGVIFGENSVLLQGSYADLSSAVQIRAAETDLKVDQVAFQNNVILDSDLSLTVKKAFCSENNFLNVQFKGDCFGTKNDLMRISTSLKEESILHGEGNQLDNSNVKRIFVLGSLNRANHVSSDELVMYRNGNQIENVEASEFDLTLSGISLRDVILSSRVGKKAIIFHSGSIRAHFLKTKIGVNTISGLRLINISQNEGKIFVHTGERTKKIEFNPENTYFFPESGKFPLSDVKDWEEYRLKK